MKKILIFAFLPLLGYTSWKGILSGELLFEDPYVLPFKIITSMFSTLGDIVSYFV